MKRKTAIKKIMGVTGTGNRRAVAGAWDCARFLGEWAGKERIANSELARIACAAEHELRMSEEEPKAAARQAEEKLAELCARAACAAGCAAPKTDKEAQEEAAAEELRARLRGHAL